MATEKRVTLLEIDIDVNAVSKKQGDLLKQIQKLKDENKELSKSTDKLTTANSKQAQAYAKNKAEISKLSQDSRTYNKILNDQSRAGEVNVKVIRKTDGSVNSLRNALNVNKTVYKSLTKEQRDNGSQGKELLKIINSQDEEYKELSRSIGNTQVDVGNYSKALDGVGNKIKGLLTAGAIFGLVKGLFNINNELREANKITSTLFSGTKEEINALTVSARGLSKAYGLDLNETLKTANVLTKQFGVDGVEALSLIEEGTRRGANANGEFLDNLKEYSTQFRLAGLSAEESISIITQQVKEGVFSDKGVDSIKEATIRLRELTPATKDALNSIGISAEQVQKDISSGAKTYFDVIQEVSRETAKFGDNSKEAGKVLADVFGGAGEDAGDFIFKLGDINLKLEEQTSILSEADEAQIALDKSWNDFTTNVGNGTSVIGKAFTFLKNQLSEVLTSLNDIGKSFEDLQEESFLSSLTKEGKSGVEEFKSFVKNLGSEETRSRKELAEVLLREDKDYLKKLENQNDENSIKTKRRLEERIKAVREFANKEVEVNKVAKTKISNSNKTRQKEDLEVYKQTANEQIESIKSNAQLEVDVRNATAQQIKDINDTATQQINESRTLSLQKNISRLQSEGATELQIRLAQLQLEKEADIQNAEETGAEVYKINEKYTKKEEAIRMAVENAKLSTIQGALGQAKGLFEENTAAYKVLAIAEASIATYLAATKALALPPPSNVIVPALTIATGLANVTKIAAFADGTESTSPYGVVDLSSHTGTIKGTSNISRSNGDNMLATVRTGEAILNKEQQSKINGWLGFNGISKAVSGYADGTTFTSPAVSSSITRNVVNNTNVSSLDNSNNFKIELDVKDVVKATDDFNVKIQDATI
jgi:hypothetical protein